MAYRPTNPGFGAAATFAKRRPQPPRRSAPPAPSRSTSPARDPRLDVFAPWSPERIDETAFNDVFGPANAQLGELRGSYSRRGDFEAGQIRQRVAALTSALMPFRQSTANIYGQAQAQQGQVGSALTGALTNVGQGLGTELGQKLRAINAPGAQVQGVAGGAEQTGAASGAAVGALSSADLERLKGEGGAADQYMQQFPRLVELIGMDQAKEITERLALELADQEGEIRAQIPGELSEARRFYLSREDQKAAQRAGILSERAETAREDKLRKQTRNQEMLDRAWEGAVLKQAYGLPLTGRDRWLINRYGTSGPAVKAAAETADNQAERQHEVRLQRMREKAAQREQEARAAAQAADDARAAMIQAQKDAARSGLERDKQRYRMALERYKAANRRKLQKQRDAAAAKRAAMKPGKDKASGGSAFTFPGKR